MKQTKIQKWLKDSTKKPGISKAWLFVFFGILGVVVSLLPTQTTQAQAQSAANVYVDRELFSDVTAKIYRDAIAACVNQNGTVPPNLSRTFPVQAIVDGEWFYSGKAVVGPLLDSTDERRSCDFRGDNGGEFLINNAMEAFGFTGGNTEAACKLGIAHRLNGDDCVTGSGDYEAPPGDTTPQEVQRAIDRQRWFDPNNPGDPNPGFDWTGPKYYIYYARSFEIGCRATPIAPYDSATADQVNLANNSAEYLWMRTVTRDGSNIKMIYRLGGDHLRDSDIGLKNNSEDFGEVELTCLELAQRANDYAEEYAQYVKSFPPEEDDNGAGAEEGEGGGENATQCDIQGIGWIVCPAMLFIGDVVDGAYGVVAGFLSVSPVSTDTGSPLFQAWSFMRNFANVAFVIVFLIIIYSQITSAGISNYNIKKMLPRLIMAAILVNVSYWVCAIAVDASNILGYSIKDLFDSVSGELFPTTPNLEDDVNQRWSPVVLGLIGGAVAGVALYAGLSMLLPLLVGALISVITALIILTLRQAFIIILIVLSPIAFVAFLLPNTQSLFDKWRKLFFTLLFMFPLVAVIFGGSALAGVVIQQSAGDDTFLQILALGVTVIPLFITVLISKMISMIGGIAGRLIGAVNDPTKGLFDRARRGAEGMRDRQQMRRGKRVLEGGRSMAGFGKFNKYRRAARRDAARAGLESEFKRSQGAYVADQAKNSPGFRDRLAGGTAIQSASPEAVTRALASAINVQASLEADEVKANHAIIKDANIDNDINKLQDLALGREVRLDNGQIMRAAPGSSLQTAAIQKQFEIGDIGMTDGLVAASGTDAMNVKQRQAIADGVAKLSGKVKYYGGTASADIAAGKIQSEADLNKLVADTVAGNKLNSAETLVQTDKDALSRISKVAADRTSVTSAGTLISNEAITNLRTAAEVARTDEIINKKAGGNVMQKIKAIEDGRAFR